MATALKDVSVHLSDPSLLREQCYVDGAWVDADGRATIEVRDPASNDIVGTVPMTSFEAGSRTSMVARASASTQAPSM